jgi:acetyl-CoA C-acetyltransferase
MGETAETLARQYAIPRDEQDRFASESQNRCERARKEGRFRDEIASVRLKAGPMEFDEHPRDGVTPEALAKLPPVFCKDGTVHAGNSSGITDGAAAVLVMSAERAKEVSVKPLARIVGATSVGLDPRVMGLGPVPAIRRLEQRLGWKLENYDIVEINEAFASQVLACDRELHFDWSRTNVNGGSIALGHPIGATGARIVVTALHELRRRGGKRALVTLCVSGGLGMAVAFETVP